MKGQRVWDDAGTVGKFSSLRSYSRYQELTLRQPLTTKSFYMLEMYVEPGGIHEYMKVTSGDIEHIEQFMMASLKAPMGFYKLLCYGQYIILHRFEGGRKIATINLKPYIRILVPGKFKASFSDDGNTLNFKNLKGDIIHQIFEKEEPDDYPCDEKFFKGLWNSLFDYTAYSEEEETVFITSFNEKIGFLIGEPLQAAETAETEEDTYVGEEVYEFESGEAMSIAEYVRIMQELL